MVKCKISFSYDSTSEFLKNVEINVNRGEILAILGPNGSGKTTILKCIAGLLNPNGYVYVDGKLGYVPQMNVDTYPYTVLEMVVMGRAPYISPWDVPSKKDYKIAMDCLKSLGISHLANKPHTQISGGELRLVMIARALATQPNVLLLDEPTAYLDFRNSHIVLEKIKTLKNKDMEIIASLHDPNECLRFADRVILLNNGKIVCSGEPRKVITPENIMKVYGIRTRIVESDGIRVIIPEWREKK